MKRLLPTFLMLCLVLGACTTTDTVSKAKIAQAIKKEGDVFLSEGDYTTALAKLLEAEKMAPNDPYLQNSLGLAYMGKRRYGLAVDAFKKALAKKTDYTEAMNNLGAAYLRQEKWDTAIVQFHRVLEDLIYPTPHFPLANIGWAYLGKQNFANAQTYFLKSLEEAPGFVTAIHGLALVYMETGQTDRAVRFLRKHLRRNPEAAILHADLARAYETKGRKEQAAKSWQMVLRLAPKDSWLYREAEDRLSEL